MEKLLHYVWKHKILPLKSLLTTDGREVEIIDPGMHNTNQGPDFFNAKLKIGGTLWAGNVELHLKSSDWFRHGHDSDPSYNNTILHVAQVVDCEVTTQEGTRPPQLRLDIPAHLYQNYQELCQTDDYPRCHKIIPSIPPMKSHMWMDALLAERMKERAQKVQDRVNLLNGDWEQATFVTLCRNFGFGLNGDTFERWAMQIPLQGIAKHRDSLFQIEAVFLGLAGLTDEAAQVKGNEMAEKWKREFAFLSHKFQMPRSQRLKGDASDSGRGRHFGQKPQPDYHQHHSAATLCLWHSQNRRQTYPKSHSTARGTARRGQLHPAPMEGMRTERRNCCRQSGADTTETRILRPQGLPSLSLCI